jgi:mannose-1-phosphate guanylyltransferase
VCAAEGYREPVMRAVPELKPENWLGEPMGRDTLNAVGFAAAVLARRDPNAVFAVLTSDHIITPQAEFARRLEEGFRLVEADPTRFVTFGIAPTFAATGYGYVERGEAIAGFDNCFHARRFVEKPDLERAQQYVASGNFSWNSGMFVMHAARCLEAIAWYRPDNAAGLARIADAWGTSRQAEVLAQVYPTLPKTSVDYGLMEPAAADARRSIVEVPMNVQWKDVGSWPTWAGTLPVDADGNRGNARTEHLRAKGVVVASDDPSHVVSVVGLDDVIVVRTATATLVCRADMAEHVKEIAARVPGDVQ